MTATHHASALLVVVATVILLVTAGRSVIQGGRSPRARDHRRTVDRAVLLVFGAFLVTEAIGLGVILTERGPRDGLHVLYGIVGPVSIVLAVMLPRMRPSWSRRRVDVILAIVGVLLLGIELRLFMTG